MRLPVVVVMALLVGCGRPKTVKPVTMDKNNDGFIDGTTVQTGNLKWNGLGYERRSLKALELYRGQPLETLVRDACQVARYWRKEDGLDFYRLPIRGILHGVAVDKSQNIVKIWSTGDMAPNEWIEESAPWKYDSWGNRKDR